MSKKKQKHTQSNDFENASYAYTVIQDVLELHPLAECVSEVVRNLADIYFAPSDDKEFSYRRGTEIVVKAADFDQEGLKKLNLNIDENYICNRTVEFASEVLRQMDDYFRDMINESVPEVTFNA
jgi:hypothetical protein